MSPWRLVAALLPVILASTPTTTPSLPTATPSEVSYGVNLTALDPHVARHCSDQPNSICYPIVLKCQLLKFCNCTMTPDDLLTPSCPCCSRCISCLDKYLVECCACVGLCDLLPPPEGEEDSSEEIEKHSEVETLEVATEGVSLFEDHFAPMNDGWQMYVFAATEELGPLGQRLDADLSQSLTAGTPNCTVAYFNECLSQRECRQNCENVVASSLRWFVTGCCECIGRQCMHTGSAKARCAKCRQEDFPHLDYDDWKDLQEPQDEL